MTIKDEDFLLSVIEKASAILDFKKEAMMAAKEFYRKKISKEKALNRQRHSEEALVAAVLYRKSIENHCPRSATKIGKAVVTAIRIEKPFSETKNIISQKELFKADRDIVRHLNLKVFLPSSVEYIPYFCLKLKQAKKIESKAIEIAKESKKRNPLTKAVSAIYLAGILKDEYKALKEITKVTGVCGSEIGVGAREIAKELNIEIPKIWEYRKAEALKYN